MKKIFALYFCILVCLTGMAQSYTYQAWVPSMGPLTFNTLGDAQHPWVQCKTSSTWKNPTTIVYPSNTSISNPSSSATPHAIITSNQEDPCRCYPLVQTTTTYPHERYLPPSWDLDYSNLQDTVIRIGCGSVSSTCNHAAQIEYWFYPEEQNSTLLVMFSFALINACTPNSCSHGVDISGCAYITNPQFYIEVYDENNQLLQLGHYPTQATQGSANPVDNPNWPYSQFLAWPSGCNAGSDITTGPDASGISTYYWAGQTNSNGSSDANGFATPTTFDYRECPNSQTGGNSDSYPVQWFEYKPLAFNLKSIASQNVDANGNFTPVKSVKLRIHTVGCSATAHWAYGLFTAKMIPGVIQVDACGTDPIHLSVPKGFSEKTYEWHYGYDSLDAITRIFDLDNPPAGITPLGAYEIFIDREVLLNQPGGRLWPYYRCEMKSYTGVPFIYEANITSYFLEPDFTFVQEFNNCDLRAKLIDASRIYTVTPPLSATADWDTVDQSTRYIKWFVKNQLTNQFDSIPNHYGDTSFTFVFYDPATDNTYKYIDPLTGDALIKIIIKDSLQKCEKEIEKSIQLDLNALQKPSTHDTLVTCREKLPYVFDRANLLNDAPVWNPQQDTTTFDTVWYKKKACNGCDSGVIVTLIVRDPKVEITTDPDFCEMFSTNLTAKCIRPGTNNEEETVLQYKWGDGETSPSITVDKPGRYSVEIINKDSCIATGNITIPACVPFMNLPNTFSPGTQDGVNDYFYIPQSSLIEELEFTVFNRNGIVVYHTTNKNFEWNGTENGRLYVGATYNYILRIKPYGSGWLDPIKRSITIF